MRRPSGLNTAFLTASVWAASVSSSSPVRADQTRAVPSRHADTIRCSSGLNETANTQSSCFNGPVIASAVRQFQIRAFPSRSEEHTSELQSPCNLVCRLLLEKKKKKYDNVTPSRVVDIL